MTHDEIRSLLLSVPGVEDGMSYGEPSYKVAGKFFTWMWPKPGDSIGGIWTIWMSAIC